MHVENGFHRLSSSLFRLSSSNIWSSLTVVALGYSSLMVLRIFYRSANQIRTVTTPQNRRKRLIRRNTCMNLDRDLMDVNAVLFAEDGELRAGTPMGLVAHLTEETGNGVLLAPTFLLTYRSFCSPKQLFQLFIRRYDVQPTGRLLTKEEEVKFMNYRKHIQLR